MSTVPKSAKEGTKKEPAPAPVPTSTPNTPFIQGGTNKIIATNTARAQQRLAKELSDEEEKKKAQKDALASAARDPSSLPLRPDAKKDAPINRMQNCVNALFQGEDLEFMTCYLDTLREDICSFCGGQGHFPHTCASKKNIDAAMKETGNTEAWAAIKNTIRSIKYAKMHEAKKKYTDKKWQEDE